MDVNIRDSLVSDLWVCPLCLLAVYMWQGDLVLGVSPGRGFAVAGAGVSLGVGSALGEQDLVLLLSGLQDVLGHLESSSGVGLPSAGNGPLPAPPHVDRTVAPSSGPIPSREPAVGVVVQWTSGKVSQLIRKGTGSVWWICRSGRYMFDLRGC